MVRNIHILHRKGIFPLAHGKLRNPYRHWNLEIIFFHFIQFVSWPRTILL